MQAKRLSFMAGMFLTLLLAACAPVPLSTRAAQTTAVQPDQAPSTSSQARTEPSPLDTVTPSFSRPTQVTNPYLPLSRTQHAVFLGEEAGKPFRAEIRLLPQTKPIAWDGGQTDAVVVQYSAVADGQLLEVAYDYYAQADDGAVYYFGEDVYNYADGQVVDQDGSWLAGRDGARPTLIMPAQPAPGMVFHPENLPDVAFETAEVTAVDASVTTPATGQRTDGVRIQETQMDGSVEYKTYGAQVGELVAEAADENSQLAVFLPTDAAASTIPAPLDTIEAQAEDIFDFVPQADWARIADDVNLVKTAWQTYAAQDAPRPVPDLFLRNLDTSLARLDDAVTQQDAAATLQAANDLSSAVVDLFSVYNPLPPADLGRLDMLERQVILDVQAGDYGAAANTLAITDAIWTRLQGDVLALHADDAAAQFSASISTQQDALAAQDGPALIQEATNGLELVDVLEGVF